MPRSWKSTSVRAAYLLAAALALTNSGCILALAGCAAGGAAGYAYCAGKLSRTYPANYADVWAATETALGELGMPLTTRENSRKGGYIESRTVDGCKVKIQLYMATSRIPVDGPMTEVCIRVSWFGDQTVSRRILDQIGFHLAPMSPPPGPPSSEPVPPTPPKTWSPGASPLPPSQPITQTAAPVQTAPPPLAQQPSTGK